MNRPNDFRTPAAVLIGTLLGWATAKAEVGMMEAAVFVAIGGAIINAAIVALVAKRFTILVALVPVVACELSRLTIGYHFDSKYEGMNLASSLQHRISFALLMLQIVPALVASGIVRKVKSKAYTIEKD